MNNQISIYFYNALCRWSKNSLIILLVLSFIQTGCKKLVAVNAPVTSINAGNVFKNDGTAISAMTSIYAKISNANLIENSSLLALNSLPGLSADELTLYSGVPDPLLAYYRNSLSANNAGNGSLWLTIYPIIYSCNAVIEGLEKSNVLTPIVKDQLMGEARFMRAFCFFYLTNLYGKIPLAVSTDYSINLSLARTTQENVYKQIIDDLKIAKSSLSERFIDKTLSAESEERVRPTKWAAALLLARTYLYTKDFENAKSETDTIISNTSLFSLKTNINDVFLRNSAEAIWQLQPVANGWNTSEARFFKLPSLGPNFLQYPVYLSNSLMQSFESGDSRRVNWVDSVVVGTEIYSYANKYKSATFNAPVTEYSSVFRLAEAYLIRAEAKIFTNGISSGIEDINTIRRRARISPTANIPEPLPDLSTSMSEEDAFNAVIRERRIEFFSEWGHRWFDLKRTGKINAVMLIETPKKGGNWASTKQLYPIPQGQLLLSPNLDQNEDY
jgi:starch-binding outer membrane protein, SusD/RagB family